MRRDPEPRWWHYVTVLGLMLTALVLAVAIMLMILPVIVNIISVQVAARVNNIAVFEEDEERRYLVARALEMIQERFETSTWKAFWDTWVCGRPKEEVAAELDLTVNAVYVARSKVLSLLRHEFCLLLD